MNVNNIFIIVLLIFKSSLFCMDENQVRQLQLDAAMNITIYTELNQNDKIESEHLNIANRYYRKIANFYFDSTNRAEHANQKRILQTIANNWLELEQLCKRRDKEFFKKIQLESLESIATQNIDLFQQTNDHEYLIYARDKYDEIGTLYRQIIEQKNWKNEKELAELEHLLSLYINYVNLSKEQTEKIFKQINLEYIKFAEKFAAINIKVFHEAQDLANPNDYLQEAAKIYSKISSCYEQLSSLTRDNEKNEYLINQIKYLKLALEYLNQLEVLLRLQTGISRRL